MLPRASSFRSGVVWVKSGLARVPIASTTTSQGTSNSLPRIGTGFRRPEASGSPTTGNPGSTGFGSLQQNFLETSNVNIVSEITDLITAQRTYEINSKVIQASDDMMGTISQIR